MARFATTRWSLILAARSPGDRTAQTALAEICSAYRAPALAYVLRQGHAREDAEDLVQDFFAHLLERRWDRDADPARGSFRAYLLTALRRFLLNARARDAAQKRAPSALAVDWERAETSLAADPSASPEHMFELAWVLTLVARAHDALAEEAAAAGKSALFEQVAPWLCDAADPSDYPRLGAELGLRANTIAVAVFRLRARLRELVRHELAQTVDDDESLEQEWQALKQILDSPSAMTPAAPGSGR